MIIIAFILWNAMWGAAGYFTVRAILNRIEYRRTVKRLVEIHNLCTEVDRALERDL